MREVEGAVRRLQAGERQALTPLYTAYAETALRTAFLITRNRTTAEDAVHEGFVQVLRSIGSLRDPGACRPWFYHIVVNAAKRLSRTRGRPVPPRAPGCTVRVPALRGRSSWTRFRVRF